MTPEDTYQFYHQSYAQGTRGYWRVHREDMEELERWLEKGETPTRSGAPTWAWARLASEPRAWALPILRITENDHRVAGRTMSDMEAVASWNRTGTAVAKTLDGSGSVPRRT